jgi:hypothetical protein
MSHPLESEYDMVDETSAALLALADRVSRAYIANEKVSAVIVAGSVARGWADGYSDVEIDTFWAEPPSEADRLAVIQAADGERVRIWPYQDDEWSEVYTVQGVKIESSQFLVGTMDGYLYDVVERFDPTIDKQVLIAAVKHAIPLHGAELVQHWQSRSGTYPAGLALATVKDHLDLQDTVYYERVAARDDVLALHVAMCERVKQLLGILCGLNRIYIPHPDFKWMDRLVGEMDIAPVDLSLRIRRMLIADPWPMVRQLRQLTNDVLDLVQIHMPDLDASGMT